MKISIEDSWSSDPFGSLKMCYVLTSCGNKKNSKVKYSVGKGTYHNESEAWKKCNSARKLVLKFRKK